MFRRIRNLERENIREKSLRQRLGKWCSQSKQSQNLANFSIIHTKRVKLAHLSIRVQVDNPCLAQFCKKNDKQLSNKSSKIVQQSSLYKIKYHFDCDLQDSSPPFWTRQRTRLQSFVRTRLQSPVLLKLTWRRARLLRSQNVQFTGLCSTLRLT